jgi:glycosyltransferase involved in cell wall biosynthesis
MIIKANRKQGRTHGHEVLCENSKPLRILIIGTLPPPIGGTTVLLQCLVKALKQNPDVELSVVDTGGVRGKGLRGALRVAALPYRMLAGMIGTDVVSLHCCTPSLPFVGMGVLLFSRLFAKPVIIRKFAGTDYRDFGRVRGLLSEFVLRRSDLYLAETHQLVEQARERGLQNVRWFPNHRHMQVSACRDPANEGKRVCRRFVYVGHVREYKGMRVLAEAAAHLPADVTVDVYGPWFSDLARHVFDNCPCIRYRGELKPEDVVPTLRKYDAFVFPTHHDGEGYPGVILEAYSVGLPVVTTRWRTLPEIVDDTVGLLVEPKDAHALCAAMTRLATDSALYQQLCSGTRAKAESFSVDTWAAEFVKFCRKVVRGATL